MSKVFGAASVLIVFGCALMFSFDVKSSDKPPEKPKSIAVSELQNMDVIGWLGKPLGTIVTVEGVIADDKYRNLRVDLGRILLRIDTVDGKKLLQEQVFQLSNNDKPKVGSKFKYIGYETGGFWGNPENYHKYAPLSQQPAYGFSTQFAVLRDELKQK